MDELSKVASLDDLLETLQKITLSLRQTYQTRLRHILRQDTQIAGFAKTLLLWLTFCFRPLHLRELEHVMAMSTAIAKLSLIHLPDMADIISFCNRLVVMDPDGNTVQFVDSAREFFQEHISEELPDGKIEITGVCIAYLSTDPFSSGKCRETKLRDRILEYPLSVYAAEFWVKHAKQGKEKPHISIIDFLSDKKIFDSWVQILGYIEDQSSDEMPLDESQSVQTQRMSERLAACGTPSEAAELLELDLIADSLTRLNQRW